MPIHAVPAPDFSSGGAGFQFRESASSSNDRALKPFVLAFYMYGLKSCGKLAERKGTALDSVVSP
jgi:hypothetical protein